MFVIVAGHYFHTLMIKIQVDTFAQYGPIASFASFVLVEKSYLKNETGVTQIEIL